VDTIGIYSMIVLKLSLKEVYHMTIKTIK